MKRAEPPVAVIPGLSSLFSTLGTPAFVQSILSSAHELFGSDNVGVRSVMSWLLKLKFQGPGRPIQAAYRNRPHQLA